MIHSYRQWLHYKRFCTSMCRAFPASLHADVVTVLRALTAESAHTGHIYELYTMRFTLPTGEEVHLPDRIYPASDELALSTLTDAQKLVYHCLFSRSYDGYRREAHLRALLAGELPDFCLPFILLASGDYVREILEVLYTGLCGRDNRRMREFCHQNMQTFLYLQARMLSYWSLYYRWIRSPASGRWQETTDYVGKRLFAECFGYTHCLEKQRRRYVHEPRVGPP